MANDQKGRALKKIAPLLIFCLFTQGCVGIAVLKTQSATSVNPEIPIVRLFDDRCLISRDAIGTSADVYTATWLEAHWGKPKSIRHPGATDSDEIWTYQFNLNWNGVVAAVLVPIPIVLPVGRERVQFVLRHGVVVSGKETWTRWVGGAYGLSAGPCGLNYGVVDFRSY